MSSLDSGYVVDFDPEIAEGARLAAREAHRADTIRAWAAGWQLIFAAFHCRECRRPIPRNAPIWFSFERGTNCDACGSAYAKAHPEHVQT